MAAASSSAPDVSERIQKVQSESADNSKFSTRLPYNAVSVCVDNSATGEKGHGVYQVTFKSIDVSSPAETIKAHARYSQLLKLSDKAFALPSAGWFEASNDPAIMTQRLPLVQTFMQAVLTEAHCGENGTPALQIIKGVSEDAIKVQ